MVTLTSSQLSSIVQLVDAFTWKARNERGRGTGLESLAPPLVEVCDSDDSDCVMVTLQGLRKEYDERDEFDELTVYISDDGRIFDVVDDVARYLVPLSSSHAAESLSHPVSEAGFAGVLLLLYLEDLPGVVYGDR